MLQHATPGDIRRAELVKDTRGWLEEPSVLLQVVESALGGVLLIDEAYALDRGDERDFGQEAIDALVNLIENHRDEMVVIAAGYPTRWRTSSTRTRACVPASLPGVADVPSPAAWARTLVTEMPARLLAFVAAIAMVVGAVAIRDRMDDNEERAATVVRIVCATELAAACEAIAEDEETGRLEVTVEPAAETAQRLSSGPEAATAARQIDGWLVTAPWPTIVVDARERNGLEPLVSAGPVLARSPVVLAVWPERGAVLARHCKVPEVTWRCLGDNAGRRWEELGGQTTWGPVKPGHPEVSSATGLAVVGAATAGYFGRTDVSRMDLENDDAYRSWLTRLERSIPVSSSPLEDMLLRGPAAFDAVGAIEAEAGPLLARSERPEKPQLTYPAPVATADVVLGTIPGRRAALITEVVAGSIGAKALAASGWRVQGQRRARGVPAAPEIPRTSGLPDPGVLEALRQVVRETR